MKLLPDEENFLKPNERVNLFLSPQCVESLVWRAVVVLLKTISEYCLERLGEILILAFRQLFDQRELLPFKISISLASLSSTE